MNNNLLYCAEKPLIKEQGGLITDVNEKFCNLTQFTKDELCGKHIAEVLHKLFRCNPKISITTEEIQAVLFTKTFEPRFVKIRKHQQFNIYYFDEIEHSRLDNKLIFVKNLINDNKIGIGIYTANDMKLIKANQKYLNYLPKPFNTRELTYGTYIGEFVPNFETSKTNELFANVAKMNKSVYLSEDQSILLDDNYYWDNNIIPISENGEVKYIMCMVENVTERVLNRKNMQRKNKQLESIIEIVADIISIIDKNGNYIKHNKLTRDIFNEDEATCIGYSTTVGKHYDFAGNTIPVDDLCFGKLLKGIKVKDQKIKYVHNGKEYYLIFNTIPIFDENNQFDMGVIMIQDVTELIEMNKLISNQKKELEIIFDNMWDVVGVVDKSGNYIKKNKALQNSANKNCCVSTFDRVGDTLLLGQKYYDDNNKELTIKDMPAYKVSKGKTVKQQRIVIKNKHNTVYLEFNAVPILDEIGNFKYGIIVAHDITHIIKKKNKAKQQQQLIIRTEHEKLESIEKALAMKDEFISLISHEFKTPLNVIYSAIQLIECVYINELPDRVIDLIKNIKQNTFRQLRLVNNLLDITRLNSGRFKLNIENIDIVSLTKQLSQSVRLYSDQKNINLLFKCNLNHKDIAIDDEKLERIILNLLSNAIKFTHAGGTVTVSLDENKDANTIVIEVSDTGIGIPKDKQKLIFERFGQVDSNLSRYAEGTGIGLSLVKKLVDILNGKIELESELDNGSTFRLTFPANKYVKNEKNGSFFNGNNRLVNALHVEFSDIYL